MLSTAGAALVCALFVSRAPIAFTGEQVMQHANPEARRPEREDMVLVQIERRGVRDERVLAALRAVPREWFVPEAHQAQAYADRALPIGSGQTISQPFMVALMTAALRPGPASRVLEVGTGSGYQAAVLAELSQHVITIERHGALASEARQRLEVLGYSHVEVVVGDGTEGYPPGAPYDGILVTAGAPHVPETLRTQLAEGGRLVIPVGTSSQQELVVIERHGDGFRETRGEGCIFVPLVGRHGWPDR
jgi:protein-L-isoaspartate(D-aspartate) O-methyltransferase